MIFEAEVTPSIYGFSSKVPVGIFKGECEVDLQRFMNTLTFCMKKTRCKMSCVVREKIVFLD